MRKHERQEHMTLTTERNSLRISLMPSSSSKVFRRSCDTVDSSSSVGLNAFSVLPAVLAACTF